MIILSNDDQFNQHDSCDFGRQPACPHFTWQRYFTSIVTNMSQTIPLKSALVVEGGAMRSVFSAGLLDGFIENQFNPFNLYIGVSAGAYNLATYLAGITGLSFTIFMEAATSKQFVNYPRFLRGGHLLDMDWLTSIVLHKYNFDAKNIFLPEKPFYVSTTNVMNGQACYIQITQDNFIHALKATTSLPLIYRNFPTINNSAMTDGGIADGIPVKQAINMGANRILVLRSRHLSYKKRDTILHKYLRWKLKKYPELAQTMRERVMRFDSTIKLLREPPAGIKVLEICPPKAFGIGRFNRNKQKLKQGYLAGRKMAIDVIRQWLNCD